MFVRSKCQTILVEAEVPISISNINFNKAVDWQWSRALNKTKIFGYAPLYSEFKSENFMFYLSRVNAISMNFVGGAVDFNQL